MNIISPEKILIDCSTFDIEIENLVFPSKYGQKEEIYSGKIRVNYYDGKINYIDRLETIDVFQPDSENPYKRALEVNEIPKEFLEWFESMKKNGKIYISLQ